MSIFGKKDTTPKDQQKKIPEQKPVEPKKEKIVLGSSELRQVTQGNKNRIKNKVAKYTRTNNKHKLSKIAKTSAWKKRKKKIGMVKNKVA